MTDERYGNVRVTKIRAAYCELRKAIRAGNFEEAEKALDLYEQWADYVFDERHGTAISQAAVAAALEEVEICPVDFGYRLNRRGVFAGDFVSINRAIRALIPTTGTEALECIKEQVRAEAWSEAKKIASLAYTGDADGRDIAVKIDDAADAALRDATNA